MNCHVLNLVESTMPMCVLYGGAIITEGVFDGG
jgi:hypothetical protein